MSHLFATAGSKLYIGGPLAWNGAADFVASDFNAQDWTEIGGVTNLGSAGDTSALVESNQIGITRTRKLKGTRNAGSMQVVADLDYADAGQLALVAAEKAKDTYAFRIVFNDAPAGGTPSVRYFTALVMSAVEQLDEANNQMRLNATLEIDSNIIRVAATDTGVAPAFTEVPTISGTATVGLTLTATPGTATGTPTPSRSLQWFADGESLPGETETTLTLTEDHLAAVITVMDTATNHLGTAYAVSAPTSAVGSGD